MRCKLVSTRINILVVTDGYVAKNTHNVAINSVLLSNNWWINTLRRILRKSWGFRYPQHPSINIDRLSGLGTIYSGRAQPVNCELDVLHHVANSYYFFMKVFPHKNISASETNIICLIQITHNTSYVTEYKVSVRFINYVC